MRSSLVQWVDRFAGTQMHLYGMSLLGNSYNYQSYLHYYQYSKLNTIRFAEVEGTI